MTDANVTCEPRGWMGLNPPEHAIEAHLSWCDDVNCVREFVQLRLERSTSNTAAIKGLQAIAEDLS